MALAVACASPAFRVVRPKPPTRSAGLRRALLPPTAAPCFRARARPVMASAGDDAPGARPPPETDTPAWERAERALLCVMWDMRVPLAAARACQLVGSGRTQPMAGTLPQGLCDVPLPGLMDGDAVAVLYTPLHCRTAIVTQPVGPGGTVGALLAAMEAGLARPLNLSEATAAVDAYGTGSPGADRTDLVRLAASGELTARRVYVEAGAEAYFNSLHLIPTEALPGGGARLWHVFVDDYEVWLEGA